ncbi:MAG TPA: sugar phosphate isomerase/epimerase [Candidatus Methanoperedens sp.]|nr:sugar phosphate isomerase/epimerase [Candidatus Methanoperedens sp.]
MRISCSSLFLWEYPVCDIMDILRKAGINSVEFWAETPFFWIGRNDETTVAELKESISIMPNGCTMHAPIMDLNPSSYNDLVHEATIKETLWSLELARIIRARVVTIHPGKRTAHRKPTNEDWEKFMKYLEISAKKARSLGIGLSLENSMPGVQSMCSDPGEMKEVLDQFPGLFFTFDVVHAFMGSPEMTLSFINELGDKIRNVHIGALHNGKPHCPVRYEKKMDIVLRRLRDSGYNGDLTIEIDDKIYPGPLSRVEKIKELTDERKYIESIFD